jgi:hypothetical protein
VRNGWWLGLAGWAVPGLGHCLQRRWVRGGLIAGAVWGTFLIGLLLGGHLFTIGAQDRGLPLLLHGLPMAANVGSGCLYLFCSMTNTGFTEQAARVTFEYGNTFLLVAGLLNYLGMLDAFDIAVGRTS